jgi:hypothetical protein
MSVTGRDREAKRSDGHRMFRFLNGRQFGSAAKPIGLHGKVKRQSESIKRVAD